MEQENLFAALDLGSNSFHLIIVKIENGRVVTLDRLKEPVRLRMGLQEDGSVSREARDRALACLTRFAQRLRGVPSEATRVVGTNALRLAKGAFPFLKEIEKTLDAPVEILGGREEARLIFLGVAQDLPDANRRYFLTDIGGGSTELAIGRQNEPEVMESVKLGCIPYSLAYFPDGQICKKKFDEAVFTVKKELSVFRGAYAPDQWDAAVGASGTVKAIASIAGAMRGQGNFIEMADLEEIKDHLIKVKNMANHRLPGLREDREPVFAGGLAILYGVFRAFEIARMEISSRSLRDGVILDFIGREKREDKRRETVRYLMDFYSADHAQAARVRETALHFLPQVLPHVETRPTLARDLMGWAADLHEIGLAISHDGYHKHGAYILYNADLAGFSLTEQVGLSALVLNQRKILKTKYLAFHQPLEWPLILVLRLAVMLHRDRRDKETPDLIIRWKKKSVELRVPEAWIDQRPLTQFDLELEKSYWKKFGYKFSIRRYQS